MHTVVDLKTRWGCKHSGSQIKETLSQTKWGKWQKGTREREGEREIERKRGGGQTDRQRQRQRLDACAHVVAVRFFFKVKIPKFVSPFVHYRKVVRRSDRRFCLQGRPVKPGMPGWPCGGSITGVGWRSGKPERLHLCGIGKRLSGSPSRTWSYRYQTTLFLANVQVPRDHASRNREDSYHMFRSWRFGKVSRCEGFFLCSKWV